MLPETVPNRNKWWHRKHVAEGRKEKHQKSKRLGSSLRSNQKWELVPKHWGCSREMKDKNDGALSPYSWKFQVRHRPARQRCKTMVILQNSGTISQKTEFSFFYKSTTQILCSPYGGTLSQSPCYIFIAVMACSFHWSTSAKSPFQALCVESTILERENWVRGGSKIKSIV